MSLFHPPSRTTPQLSQRQTDIFRYLTRCRHRYLCNLSPNFYLRSLPGTWYRRAQIHQLLSRNIKGVVISLHARTVCLDLSGMVRSHAHCHVPTPFAQGQVALFLDLRIALTIHRTDVVSRFIRSWECGITLLDPSTQKPFDKPMTIAYCMTGHPYH